MRTDGQQNVFYDELAVGDRVLLFGAVHSEDKDSTAAPEVIDAEKASNYRRWWNNPWSVVESAGQAHAGEWSPEKMTQLRAGGARSCKWTVDTVLYARRSN